MESSMTFFKQKLNITFQTTYCAPADDMWPLFSWKIMESNYQTVFCEIENIK